MASTINVEVARSRPTARSYQGGIHYREVDADVRVTYGPGDEKVARELLDEAYRAAALELAELSR
jgi:hypothetical protein